MSKQPHKIIGKKLFTDTELKRAKQIGIALLVLAFGLQFFMKPYSHFGLDGTMFFHVWYGLATCVGFILVAKLFGYLLKVKPDYYEDND